MSGCSVGRFRLVRLLGRGGMGEVWLAQDEGTGLEAAIKWIDHPNLSETLEAEIRAVAAMAHPHIAAIFDAGRTREPLQIGSRTLPPQIPWFAMEYLPGGSVERVRCYEDLKQILSDVLSALAHAHARGWIHCDLKPQNVLRDAQGRTAVADFGVARARQPSGPLRPGGGTPEFMAPEQIFAQEWRIGPWTDLFSVGILAWVLCTGSSPLPSGGRGEGGLARVREAHHRPLPALSVPFAAPPGLPGFVARLTHPQPSYRLRTAAEALSALSALSAPGFVSEPDPSLSEMRWFGEIVPPPRRPSRPLPAEIPRLSSAAARHRGAGLFRRREIGIVGRSSELGALWEALSAVAASGKPAYVALSGRAGSGKSALARGFCALAEEVGAAKSHAVVLSSGTDASRALLVSVLGRMAGADLALVLPPLGVPDAAAAARLMVADGPMNGDRAANVARDAAVALSEGSTLAIWIDDADRSASSEALVEALLAADHPILVVDTRREPASALQPRQITLGPLAEADICEILARMLPVSGDLCAEIARLSDGLPLVAVALLADLLDRSALRWSGTSYVLASGHRLSVPGDIRADLVEHVGNALGALRLGGWRWVEIAASLGAEIERDLWMDVSRALGLGAPPEPLVVMLIERGILEVDPDDVQRLRFVHALYAEAIAESAIDRASIHIAAAEAWFARGGVGFERAAEHFVASGHPERAAEAWFKAGGFWYQRDITVMRALMSQVLARGVLSGSSLARVAARLSEAHRALGDYHRALDVAERGIRHLEPGAAVDTVAALYNHRLANQWMLARPLEGRRELIRDLLPRVVDPTLRWHICLGEAQRAGTEGLEWLERAASSTDDELLRAEARMMSVKFLIHTHIDRAESELGAVRDKMLSSSKIRETTWWWIHAAVLEARGRFVESAEAMRRSIELRARLSGGLLPRGLLCSLGACAWLAEDRELLSFAISKLGPKTPAHDLLFAALADLEGRRGEAERLLEAIDLAQLEPELVLDELWISQNVREDSFAAKYARAYRDREGVSRRTEDE